MVVSHPAHPATMDAATASAAAAVTTVPAAVSEVLAVVAPASVVPAAKGPVASGVLVAVVVPVVPVVALAVLAVLQATKKSACLPHVFLIKEQRYCSTRTPDPAYTHIPTLSFLEHNRYTSDWKGLPSHTHTYIQHIHIFTHEERRRIPRGVGGGEQEEDSLSSRKSSK